MKLLLCILLLGSLGATAQTQTPNYQDSAVKYGKAFDYMIQRYEHCTSLGEKKNLYYITEWYKARFEYYYEMKEDQIRQQKMAASKPKK